MSKLIGLIIVVVVVAILGYVAYESWHVFGVTAMLLSIFANSGVGPALTHFIGCKTQTPNGYMFNPKELPKYLAMLVAAGIGYYLYMQLDNPDLTSYDRKFGMAWIILGIALPVVFQLYTLNRDKNDYVEIAGPMLKYRDNDDIGEVPLQHVKQVELAGKDVKLVLMNDQEMIIKTSQMNFGGRDLVELITTIHSALPQASQ